jgi:cephalosporin-C deacetylase-like acetyl esterase
LQGDTRADKNGRAAHDFRVGVDDAFQIFHCHNMATIPLPVKLSPANMDVVCAPALSSHQYSLAE